MPQKTTHIPRRPHRPRQWPPTTQSYESLPQHNRRVLDPWADIQHTSEATAFRTLVINTCQLTTPGGVASVTYKLLTEWILGPTPPLESWNDSKQVDTFTSWMFKLRPTGSMRDVWTFKGREGTIRRHLQILNRAPLGPLPEDVDQRITARQVELNNVFRERP